MKGFLTRDERSVMLFLALAVAVGSFVVGVAKVDPRDGGRDPANAAGASEDRGAEAPLRVELNTADAQELTRLPGIGPAKAEAIVELRGERGGFRSVDELDDVKGIGPATLERLRPFAFVRGDSAGALLGPDAGPAAEESSLD